MATTEDMMEVSSEMDRGFQPSDEIEVDVAFDAHPAIMEDDEEMFEDDKNERDGVDDEMADDAAAEDHIIEDAAAIDHNDGDLFFVDDEELQDAGEHDSHSHDSLVAPQPALVDSISIDAGHNSLVEEDSAVIENPQVESIGGATIHSTGVELDPLENLDTKSSQTLLADPQAEAAADESETHGQLDKPTGSLEVGDEAHTDVQDTSGDIDGQHVHDQLHGAGDFSSNLGNEVVNLREPLVDEQYQPGKSETDYERQQLSNPLAPTADAENREDTQDSKDNGRDQDEAEEEHYQGEEPEDVPPKEDLDEQHHHQDEYAESSTDTLEAGPTPIHPILVHYQDNVINLFPPKHDEQGSAMYLLEDEALASEGFSYILESCKSVLADSILDSEELELNIPSLGIRILESAQDSASTSLAQVLSVYLKLHQNDGVEVPESLHLFLAARQKVSSRMNYLLTLAADGKGLSHINTFGNGQGLEPSSDSTDAKIPPANVDFQNSMDASAGNIPGDIFDDHGELFGIHEQADATTPKDPDMLQTSAGGDLFDFTSPTRAAKDGRNDQSKLREELQEPQIGSEVGNKAQIPDGEIDYTADTEGEELGSRDQTISIPNNAVIDQGKAQSHVPESVAGKSDDIGLHDRSNTAFPETEEQTQGGSAEFSAAGATHLEEQIDHSQNFDPNTDIGGIEDGFEDNQDFLPTEDQGFFDTDGVAFPTDEGDTALDPNDDLDDFGEFDEALVQRDIEESANNHLPLSAADSNHTSTPNKNNPEDVQYGNAEDPDKVNYNEAHEGGEEAALNAFTHDAEDDAFGGREDPPSPGSLKRLRTVEDDPNADTAGPPPESKRSRAE